MMPDKCSVTEEGKQCVNPPEFIVSIVDGKDEYMFGLTCQKHRTVVTGKLGILQNEGKIHNGKISFKDLQKHLYFDKKNPNGIPYVTSYYKKNWGFCLAYNDFIKLSDGDYHVNIKSKFKKGAILIGESFIKGRTKREILLSSYLCHPSLANNELSGPIVLAYLYQNLKKLNLNYTYRFIINPETIGSLCYLSSNFQNLKDNVVGGIVLTCLGGRRIN